MLNVWRLVRTFGGIILISSPAWANKLLHLDGRYVLGFLFMGFYVLFLDIFSLLVLYQRADPRSVGVLRSFLRRYRFWKWHIRKYPITFRAFCPEATMHKPAFVLCSGYEDWAPVRMEQEKCGTGWWVKTLELPVGRYEYIYRIGSEFRPDPDVKAKKVQNPFGGNNSLILVGIDELPGARVQIRNTSTQILIAVAGFILAFASSSRGSLPLDVVLPATLSAGFGLLYNFVFGGSVAEERHNGEPHVVKVWTLHEEVMEILLNLQVLSLLFALTGLADP